METIHRYVARRFLSTFGITLAVVTFVMCLGAFFRVADLLARDVAWRTVLGFFVTVIPYTLGFSMPISALTAALLVFGRLSADGEITALKASGVSLWRVIMTPLWLAVVFTLACVWLHMEMGPRSHYRQRVAMRAFAAETPLQLLEEGRFIRDFPGFQVYIGRRSGNAIEDVFLHEMSEEGIRRTIRARRGRIRQIPGENKVVLELEDVMVDPFYEDRPGAGFCRELPVELDFAFLSRHRYRKSKGDLTFWDLMERIGWAGGGEKQVDEEIEKRLEMSVLLLEMNKRLGLSASCFAFVLLGIPLAIRAHRKESSIGVAISLGLVVNFYLFVIAADALVAHPEVHPYLIVWIPVLLSVFGGMALIHRAE